MVSSFLSGPLLVQSLPGQCRLAPHLSSLSRSWVISQNVLATLCFVFLFFHSICVKMSDINQDNCQ